MLLLIGLRRLRVRALSFSLDYDQAAISTADMQESTIWADKHGQYWEIIADLKSTEAKHWGKHT